MRRFVIAALVPVATGCFFGGRVADRTVRISQRQSAGRTGAFAVDTSRLPPGLVIELEAGYPVRVVPVPAARP